MFRKIIYLLVIISTSTLNAQWSQDPGDAIHLRGIWAGDLVSDSLGGVFISAVGRNNRSYCYYIDRNGFPHWDEWVDIAPLAESSLPPGHAICPETGYIVTLGYFTWLTDEGDTTWDIRAQKIDVNGEFAWPDSGVSVCEMRLRREDNARFDVIGMESDGCGGVIVTWVVQYFNNQGSLIRQPFRAQRISADGELRWDEEQVEVVNEDSLASHGLTVSDGIGGVIILYYIGGINAQRISQNGNKLWGDLGVGYNFNAPRNAVSDGNNGVVICSSPWGRGPIVVLRLNADGQQLWGDGDGIVVKDAERPYDMYLHNSWIHQVSDSIFFANWKGRTEDEPHPLVQSINLTGELQWDWPGIQISNADSIQFNMQGIKSDNSAIYAWFDRRDLNNQTSSVYAQRLDINGNRLWGENDVLLLNVQGVGVTDIISDMNGGAIFFLGSSYLQYINHNGELGIPLTIRDFDQPLQEGLTSYSIFPNPANSLTTLNFSKPTGRDVTLKFFDLHGRLIFDNTIDPDVTMHPIDISNLPTGSYMLLLGSDTEEAAGILKIIK